MARRELSEEVGATCRSLQNVGRFYGAVSTNTGQCVVFLARGVQINGASHREPGEIIEVHPALMAHSGQIKDSKSALALLLCEPYLQMAEG